MKKKTKKRRVSKCEQCGTRHRTGPCADKIRSDCDNTYNPYEG